MEDFNSKYTGEEVEQLLDDVGEVVGEDGYVYSNGEKVDMRFTRSLLPVGTAIPANANLNSIAYLKIGKYYCSLNVDAKTITNCPVDIAFSMEVFNPLGTNVDDEETKEYTYRLRVLTAYNTGIQYIQYCATSGTPGSWSYNSWYIVPRTSFAIASDKNGGSAAKGGSTRGVYIDSTGTFQQMGYTIAKSVPSNAVFTDTNTKVTAVGNHYAPAEDADAAINAPEGEVIVGLKRDAAGHIVGITTTPSNSGGGGETLTEADIAAMGFTKNEGTITEVKMNGVSKGTSGVVDLGDVQTPISDLADIRSGAAKGATAVQPSSLAAVATSGSYNDLVDKPKIPNVVTEATVSGWGFTKNTGTYSKPSGGIPKSDLASNVQESLSKAESAVQIKTIGGLTVVETRALNDGGMVYSTPYAATGDEDDILLSKNSVKTINGESIFGGGNITIEGGGGSSSGGGKEIVIMDTSTVNTLEANKIYIINGPVDSWVEIYQIASSTAYWEEYSLIFKTVDNGIDIPYIMLPDDVRWANGTIPDELEFGTLYELSISKTTIFGNDYFNAVLTPFKPV